MTRRIRKGKDSWLHWVGVVLEKSLVIGVQLDEWENTPLVRLLLNRHYGRALQASATEQICAI